MAYGAVARATADGYNLLIFDSAYHIGNPALSPTMPWATKDVFTISSVGENAQVKRKKYASDISRESSQK